MDGTYRQVLQLSLLFVKDLLALSGAKAFEVGAQCVCRLLLVQQFTVQLRLDLLHTTPHRTANGQHSTAQHSTQHTAHSTQHTEGAA